jgi:hypothetical protein
MPDSEPPPPSNRRTAERHLACFPAEVKRPDGETRYSIIRDLSKTGALLLVRTDLDVGDRVRLTLHLSERGFTTSAASGKVVRTEPLSDDEVGLWTRKIAVQFDEPLDMAESELEALRERRARLGL